MAATKPGEISIPFNNNNPAQPPDCVISIPLSSPNEILNNTNGPNRTPKIPKSPGPGITRRPKPKLPIDTEALESLGNNFDLGSLIQSSRPNSLSRSSRRSLMGGSARNKEVKVGPDEREVYRRVTAQLSARKNMRMTVKCLIQLAVFLAILSCLICSFTVEKMHMNKFYGLKLWKWFVLLMVIFSGMLITRWFVHVAIFFIEWKFIMKKNVLYFTHGLKTSVVVFIWIAVVLGTWIALFKHDMSIESSQKTRKFLDIVTWTIASLLIGSFLWLLKNTLLKVMASAFHLNRFFDRIQESVYHHYVLQVLSGSPVMESTNPAATTLRVNDAAAKGKTQTQKVVDVEKLHKMKKEKVPSYTVQLLVNVVANSGLSTMSGMLEEDHVEGGVALDDDEITSEEQAIATAVGIFENIVKDKKEDREYIDRYDLMKFMIEEEVDYLLQLLETDDKGQISLQLLTKWVVKVFKDRLQLQNALNDNKTAVKQLNKIISAILVVICFVLWLLLTGIASTKLLLFLSSQLVVAAFVFGNTCKTIFEAIIFVFVMHPFDVGDRCLIDGTMMIVEEMNILTTVLLKPDKEKVFYPNSQLANKPISNFYRSPENQGDTVEFAIDFMTPLAKIGELKERIKKYLEENQHFWSPDHNVVVREIENVNKIKMALVVTHTMNFQDYAEKNRRKTELILELKKIFEDLQIRCNLLPQEIILNGVPPVANATSHY